MNFIIRNLLLFTVLLCTVACSSDENFDQSSWKNIDFRVSVVGQSRVAIQKDGSGDFQAGDEVALRVYESQPDKQCHRIPVYLPWSTRHTRYSHQRRNETGCRTRHRQPGKETGARCSQ